MVSSGRCAESRFTKHILNLVCRYGCAAFLSTGHSERICTSGMHTGSSQQLDLVNSASSREFAAEGGVD